MPNIEWSDSTGYAQGERGKTSPSSWTARIAGYEVTVCQHVTTRPEWALVCYQLDIKGRSLKTQDLSTAKAHALEFVRQAASQRKTALEALLEEL